MHSVMCLRHMGNAGYKEDGRDSTKQVMNQMSFADDKPSDVADTEVSVASTTGEPIVIEAQPPEPDGYAEDGTPIFNIN